MARDETMHARSIERAMELQCLLREHVYRDGVLSLQEERLILHAQSVALDIEELDLFRLAGQSVSNIGRVNTYLKKRLKALRRQRRALDGRLDALGQTAPARQAA